MITKVGKMEIIPKIKELIAKPVNAAYQCWMCGEKHNDAAQYLLHINTCKMKVQPILAKQ